MKHKLVEEFEKRLVGFVRRQTGADVEVHLTGIEISDRDAALDTVISGLAHGTFKTMHPVSRNHGRECRVCSSIVEQYAGQSVYAAKDFVSDCLDLIAQMRLEKERE